MSSPPNIDDGGYVSMGPTIEPKAIIKMEKAFNMNVVFFEHSVILQQKFKLKRTGPVKIAGTVEYMTRNDDKCLPPEVVESSVPVNS